MEVVKYDNYYYLSHSFRFNNKVVHRQKYLWKKVPVNLEELKEAFLRECKIGRAHV